jgi:hypothetical protein
VSTADALLVVNFRLFVCPECESTLIAELGTDFATVTLCGIDLGFAVAVHNHFPCPASTTHPDILDCTAETGTLVSFEVIERNDNIGIHDSTSDESRFAIDSVSDGNLDVVRSFQTVADDIQTACRDRIESVLCCRMEMYQSIVPPTNVKRIAIRQEGKPAERFDFIGDDFCPIRTQIGHITGFAEMDFNGDELILKVNFFNIGFDDKAFQFCQWTFAHFAT